MSLQPIETAKPDDNLILVMMLDDGYPLAVVGDIIDWDGQRRYMVNGLYDDLVGDMVKDFIPTHWAATK